MKEKATRIVTVMLFATVVVISAVTVTGKLCVDNNPKVAEIAWISQGRGKG